MKWYCVYTKPCKEEQASTYCRTNLELETYYPRLRQQRIIRRVKKITTNPLFPRYFFCRFDLGTDYRRVRYAPEIIDLVHFGDRPAEVQDALLDQLKFWAGETVDIISIQEPLRPGVVVEITDGPLRGLPGVITNAKDDRDRVAVLLSVLQCGAQITISRSRLKRVG